MKRITKLNKILSLVLALVMVFAFSVPAFASGGQGSGNQDNPTMAGNSSSGFQLGFHDPYIDMSAAHGRDGTQEGKETAYFDIQDTYYDSREDISFTVGLNPCGGQKNFTDVDFSGMYIYSTADKDTRIANYEKGESGPITVSELKTVSTDECAYSVANERHVVITIKGGTLAMDGRYRLVIPGTVKSSNEKMLGVNLEVTFDTGVRSSEPEKLYDGTYLLRTSGDFDWFANAINEKTIPLDSDAKLMNSIDLSYNKTFIGRFTRDNGYKAKYTGTFDGNGYTLTLNIFNMSSSGFATSGVFNYLGEGAVVKNLTVDGKVSTGDDYGICSHVGGIVAFADGSVTIENCVNNAEVYAPCASLVGGIIGSGNDITIIDCVNNGKVTGYRNVGGIIGELVFMDNKVSLIKNCVNYGDLVSPDKNFVLGENEDGSISYADHIWSDSIGGIVGSTYVLAPLNENPDRTGIVTNCVNYGDIYTPVSAGGIIGEGTWGGPKTVENCYNAGDIIFSRTDSLYKNDYRVIIGGIAGQLNGKLLYSYNSGKITMLTTPKENYIGAVYATRTSDTFANNAFALEGTYSALTSNGETANMKFLTPDELKTDSVLLKDGRFVSDSTSENPLNDGYPILPFQTKAESVEIADDKLDITEGDKVMLDLKKSPEGSIVGTLEWTSSDETVATVENGVVTALKQGTTIITLKDPATGSEDTVEIKVTCNHDIISVVTKKATCEESGFENLSCSKCDYTLEGNVIPKTGHKISDWKYNDEKHYKVCLNEGCTAVFEEGDHESGRKQAATTTKKATCRVCGAEYGDLLPTGWVLRDGSYYYYDSTGTLTTGWQIINGKYYYLDPDNGGKMVTGWARINGKWYYMNKWGAMVTGWARINGKWYYMNKWGAMVTGWAQISGKWYYMNSSGAMVTGWAQINGKWYYMSSSGAMLTGWQRIGGKWYYMNSSGAMLTGTQRINGKYYRFNSSGVWIA